MIRWFIKWVFRLALLAVVLVIAFLLSFNTIVRLLMEHNIRAQTGMDAEIGRVEAGWTEPTFEIRDLKIYNSPSFGGTPFLDVPEIHIEYDRTALVQREIHLTLLRLNLDELDIVRSRKGDLNVARGRNVAVIGYAFQSVLSGLLYANGRLGHEFAPNQGQQKNSGISLPSFKGETGYDFKGIDALNVSFNKAKFIDLQDRRNDREQTIGLQNCVVPDVKSARDLAGLALIIDLRSDHFFDPLVSQQVKSEPWKSVSNVMGAAF